MGFWLLDLGQEVTLPRGNRAGPDALGWAEPASLAYPVPSYAQGVRTPTRPHRGLVHSPLTAGKARLPSLYRLWLGPRETVPQTFFPDTYEPGLFRPSRRPAP